MTTIAGLKKVLLAFALGFASAGSAHAAIVTYSGLDDGAVPGGTFINSAAAEASFIGAVGPTTLIDFEGLTLGIPSGLVVVPGVTLTVTGNNVNVDGGIRDTLLGNLPELGFNTTLNGSHWLLMSPTSNSTGGATATFSFSSPINAFGFYLTGSEISLPGTITVSFFDGLSQTLPVTKNSNSTGGVALFTGGVAYFGFSSLSSSFNTVSINTGATTSAFDLWGIDDVRFSNPANVPEPGTLALLGLGLGLAGLAASRRRKQ